MVVFKNYKDGVLGIVAEVIKIYEGDGINANKARKILLRYRDVSGLKNLYVEFWNAPEISGPQMYSKSTVLLEGDIVYVEAKQNGNRCIAVNMLEPSEGVFECEGSACYFGYIDYGKEDVIGNRKYSVLQSTNLNTSDMYNNFIFENRALGTLAQKGDLVFIIARRDMKRRKTSDERIVDAYLGEEITVFEENYFDEVATSAA